MPHDCGIFCTTFLLAQFFPLFVYTILQTQLQIHMERFEKKTEILTDLLHINKDCSETCRNYIVEYQDKPEEATVIERLVGLCRDCITELHLRIDPTYGDPADAIDLKGGIYRSWVQNDEVYFARRTPGIINSCEQKLRSIQMAYEQALNRGKDLNDEIRSMLDGQLRRVLAAAEYIQGRQQEATISTVA
jgi:uncharacterized protein (TIGR02284 family)